MKRSIHTYEVHIRDVIKKQLLLTIFKNVFIYLSTTILSPSKWQAPSDIIHLWNAPISLAKSSCFDFAFTSIVIQNAFLTSLSSIFKRRKSQRGPRWTHWLRQDYGFVFGQNLRHKHWCLSWCVIIHVCLVITTLQSGLLT